MSRTAAALFLVVGIGLYACREKADQCPCCRRTLRVSSTTSVDNTGLLKEILPPFEKRTGIRVQVLAVGTGQALKLAENGDVDAVFVHAPALEREFVRAGHGVHRLPVMVNDFVIVGPRADPAGIGGLGVLEALGKIREAGATFVSRGDESGTHQAERNLWREAGIQPSGDWYLESGQGQRLNLNMADEKQGYTLTDRATWLVARAQELSLVALVQGDPRLHNPYSAIAVNPERHPEARYVEAMAFLGWLTSVEGQGMIGEFKPTGQALFTPNVLKNR